LGYPAQASGLVLKTLFDFVAFCFALHLLAKVPEFAALTPFSRWFRARFSGARNICRLPSACKCTENAANLRKTPILQKSVFCMSFEAFSARLQTLSKQHRFVPSQ